MRRTLRMLELERPPAPPRWPKLSVIIPACNEGDTIGPALAKLRELDYPDLELILIDDRSSDDTGAQMDRVAKEDPRFRVLHLSALPEGWLGKVHALQRGTELASGEVLLFTDADVLLAPETLKRTVSMLEERQLDHLCVIPELHSSSFWASTVVASAMRTIALSQRPWHAEDPKRKEAIGSGAFNMVRRSFFAKTEGFDWLRLEVADDIGLGHLMKLRGGKPGLAHGVGWVKVAWYPTLRSAIRGLEKNGFAQIARYSLARGLVAALLYLWITLAPYLALASGVPWVQAFGLVGVLSLVGTGVLLSLWTGHGLGSMLLSAPLGDLLIVYICARSTILGARRGGLIWRGTVYPSEALRAGMKVKF